MNDDPRIHDFSDEKHAARIADSRDVVRAFARAITGDEDVRAEEGYAQALDELFGHDEVRIGATMTMLLECSSDPRDYTEKVLLAADLFRRARRTRH